VSVILVSTVNVFSFSEMQSLLSSAKEVTNVCPSVCLFVCRDYVESFQVIF